MAALAVGRGLLLPVVVLELLLGILLGPWVLGLHVTVLVGFFSDLGLGLLLFFAGYEIDVRRIAGRPLRLALAGWGVSLLLAYAIGGILAEAGVVLSLLYTGSALATTAIGTLIPVLSDTGDLRTRFGGYLLAAGAVGEFGPILLITLILSSQSTVHNALILIAFIVLAVAVAVLAVRSSERTMPLLERTLESSSQLAVRWIIVLVFAFRSDRVHRPGGRRGRARRALLRADHAVARANTREQLTAGGQMDHRARLRTRPARVRIGPRPAARRFRDRKSTR